jgi:hypothetical protein
MDFVSFAVKQSQGLYIARLFCQAPALTSPHPHAGDIQKS